MLADAAGVADRLDKVHLAAAVGGQILHQQHSLAGQQLAFDLCVAAETLGFFAHVLHRQIKPLGHPGGEGDAGGLAARHRIELVGPMSRSMVVTAKSIMALRTCGNDISRPSRYRPGLPNPR